MRIVLAGYIVGYPLGGMTWHHLNYLAGLAALGHEVTYLEDGAFHPPFDPSTGTTGDPAYGLSYLRHTLEQYGYGDVPWHYRYGEFSAGLSNEEINRHLRNADLLICVSGVTPLDWYDRPTRSLVIDTDPVFTQIRLGHDAKFAAYYRSFTHVATFGRLIGTPASPLPTHGLDWIPTNQPVSLRHWPVLRNRGTAFTTIGKWEHSGERTVEFAGRRYASSKAAQWMSLLGLPARVAELLDELQPVPGPVDSPELRMATAEMPEALRERFGDAGWALDEAYAVSADPRRFRGYVAESAGELTVSKEIYAALPSGWFSDRSACFLMCGRPVITQSSGFEHWLPTGEGLCAFRTPEEAAESVAAVWSDLPRHSRAARRIAEAHFDAERVLKDLLDRCA